MDDSEIDSMTPDIKRWYRGVAIEMHGQGDTLPSRGVIEIDQQLIKRFVATTVRHSLTLQSHCVRDVTVSLKKESEAVLSRKERTGMGTILQIYLALVASLPCRAIYVFRNLISRFVIDSCCLLLPELAGNDSIYLKE